MGLESILDSQRIDVMRTLENGDDLIVKIIDIFVGETPARIDRIRIAAAKSDLEVLRKESHLLGGGAACIGASQLSTLAGQLEQIVSQGIFDSSHLQLCDEIFQEWTRLSTSLENHFAELLP